MPLINLVRLNLVADSKEEHKPLCSHPIVLRLKKEMNNSASSLTSHSSSTPNTTRPRKSRQILTEMQKQASVHIQNFQRSQIDAFLQLEKVEKSPPDMYKDKRGLYPVEYKGLGKCHVRALHNVHEAVAARRL